MPNTDEPLEGGAALERIIFFSDAVFAIALTLLVLDLHSPEPESVSPEQLPQAILALAPRFLSLFISFGVIGLYWIGHHRTFRYIARYDYTLVIINLIYLLSIVFLPFPTAILARYSNSRFAVIFYAANLIIAGIVSTTLWEYAVSHHLIAAGTSRAIRQEYRLRPLLPVVFFLLSIGLSFWSVAIAEYSWLLLLFTPLLAWLFARHLDTR